MAHPSLSELIRRPKNTIFYVIILLYILSIIAAQAAEPLSQYILIFVASLLLLVKSAEYMVEYSSKYARYMGIPAIIIGITIVAFGTSLPELVVSLFAYWSPDPAGAGLSVGNIVGSNISNICLVLGIAAILVPIRLNREILRFDMPFLVGISFLLLALIVLPLSYQSVSPFLLGPVAGIVLLILFAFFMRRQIRVAHGGFRIGSRGKEREPRGRPKGKEHLSKSLSYFLFIAISLGFLLVSSAMLVDSSLELALIFEVPPEIIGLTMVAVGTSLPELATNIVAVLKRKLDLAIGTVIGSNIFNILLVLGTTSFSSLVVGKPLLVSMSLVMIYIPIMIGVTVLLFLMMRSRHTISRKEGLLLFTLYIAYLAVLATVGTF